MKLYHHPHTRSFRPLWLLEELQVPYELIDIDIFHGEGRTESYRQINPYGKVPTLDDDGTVIYEAGAICLYLADKFVEKNLAPALNTPERGLYYQWMFFAPGTMEPPLMNIFLHSKLLPEEERIPILVEQGVKQFNKIADNLNQTIEKKPYLLGDQFSTADIMVSSTLQWFPDFLDDRPELKAYVNRNSERPAYQRAQEHNQ